MLRGGVIKKNKMRGSKSFYMREKRTYNAISHNSLRLLPKKMQLPTFCSLVTAQKRTREILRAHLIAPVLGMNKAFLENFKYISIILKDRNFELNICIKILVINFNTCRYIVREIANK